MDSTGNLYVAGYYSHRVRKVSGGVIFTVAGNGSNSFSGDGGQAINAQLDNPQALAIDNAGTLYVADTDNSRVRAISNTGIITTMAGGGTQYEDGLANPAFVHPLGVAADGAGNVYVTDVSQTRTLKVSGGVISTITSTISGAVFATVNLIGGGGVTADSEGRIYLSDAHGNVRLLTPTSQPCAFSLTPTSSSALPKAARCALLGQ